VRAEVSKPKGLGDPGKLTALKVEPNINEKGVAIRGRDARQQIFVTGVFSSGQFRDFTRKTAYTAAPEDIVKIDANGMVLPVADGTATITATDSATGLSATLPVTVSGMAGDLPINFTNQIVPIFTKLGCNGGGCHGKSSGQNGFKLSLLGFYPDEDFEYLVKEAGGARRFRPPPGKAFFLTNRVVGCPTGAAKGLKIATTNTSV